MSDRDEQRLLDRRRFVIGAGALGALAIARPALAWIPPADFLIGRMAERRKSVRTLSVKGIRTFIGRSFEDGKQDVAETLLANAKDGGYRLERKTPKGVYLEVSDGARRVVVVDGKPGALEIDPRPFERLLFTTAGKDELLRAAQAFGIRLEIVSLGRLEGRIAWIVGAKAGDTTSPQLWIDKEGNLPLQLVDPRARRTVRFEGWGEPGGAGVVPTRVSILRGEDVVESLKVEQTKLNAKFKAELLEPEAVLAAVSPKPTPKPKP